MSAVSAYNAAVRPDKDTEDRDVYSLVVHYSETCLRCRQVSNEKFEETKKILRVCSH